MVRALFICQLVCLLALGIGFANADEPEKLVGASNSRPAEFPYAVSIQMYGKHFCGGAIVSNYHIITAAHCVVHAQKNPLADVVVVTGTINLENGGETYKVSKMFAHPDHKGGWFCDVGILKLEKPIRFNAYQNKIALPTKKVEPDTFAVIASWGSTGTGPDDGISNYLQKLYLRIISRSDCKVFHGSSIHNNMICTYNDIGVGTCSGDSGSPLVQKGEIVGVVAGGVPCAVGYPDVFAYIYSMLPFVNQAMRY